ncbi:putative porin [Salinibacter altiplanensis]|uniref:putative porin n=1 Tax=Salinibacter altiplanensis TaxID=1803181 RepID=UPI00131A3E92|nr:putative porin [Salinibacter altiplanensis]
MPSALRSFLRLLFGLLLVGGVGLGSALMAARFAHAQADTTAAPDTLQRPSAAAPGRSSSDTSTARQESFRPLSPSLSPYGRARSDSLPGRRPHVSVEMMLAEQPGSFLYDLGEYGWPHGWSPRGLAPHRVHLWSGGLPVDDPLTGRARFELLPPSFLTPPRTGLDPGGGAVGVHTAWRTYAPKRPVTELRYRFDRDGLHAIEVGHSQKRRLDLFGPPGVLHLTFGYGGRKADGIYNGSALRTERRIWGRLRYLMTDWAFELSDRSTLYRIGAHGGAVQSSGTSIYALPLAASNVRRPNDRRKTVRNDLTARLQGPLVPGLSRPMDVSARWTSHTFDFRSTGGDADTTWTVPVTAGHIRARQSLRVGAHHLTGSIRGSLWRIGDTNLPTLDGRRGAAHVLLRDSLRLGRSDVTLNVGGHVTSQQRYPSVTARLQRPVGPVQLFASVTATGQRGAWIEDDGFASHVQPLAGERGGGADRVLEGTIGGRAQFGPFSVEGTGFAHRIQNAVDLYAVTPEDAAATTITNEVAARQTSAPVQRVGATASLGWRENARRGLYATGHGTLLQTLDADASSLHARLANTLPEAFGRARLGARFVLFDDLLTDLYVQGRGWGTLNSRWFHPPTGRLVVPPRTFSLPKTSRGSIGPSGTVDVRAEVQFRSATLFFTFQNVQAGTQLQPGTFVTPVYPLPPQQFRFGVFWPIFN